MLRLQPWGSSASCPDRKSAAILREPTEAHSLQMGRRWALYARWDVTYVHEERRLAGMGNITTLKEQRETSAAARKVGGYAELVRLANERRLAGNRGKLVQREGRWSVVEVEPKP
jgi:hypothetical protein